MLQHIENRYNYYFVNQNTVHSTFWSIKTFIVRLMHVFVPKILTETIYSENRTVIWYTYDFVEQKQQQKMP